MPSNENQNKPTRGTGENNEEFPGYPHYPAEDDITNPQHGLHKVSADEELANSARISSQTVRNQDNSDSSEDSADEDDLEIVSGTDADVTEEDLLILGDRDADQDLGDDEQTRKARVDDLEEEQDLDIPGAQMNDEEALGQDDEENNYYSLGGDRHESLEEDSAADNE